MLSDEIAHLRQVKHLMNPKGLGMGHHGPPTARSIDGRVMWDLGQLGIVRMPLAAMPLVTGLRPSFLAGGRSLAGWRHGSWPIAGRWLGGVSAVLIEAVLQLGNTIEELIN